MMPWGLRAALCVCAAWLAGCATAPTPPNVAPVATAAPAIEPPPGPAANPPGPLAAESDEPTTLPKDLLRDTLAYADRTLGASSRQMFFSVTLPGAVPVLFSGLRLGVIYALLGVVGAEVIASERGLGQQLAYLGSTFNVNGVWSLLFDLALIGVLIMKLMNWVERRLLHWQ